MSVGRRYS